MCKLKDHHTIRNGIVCAMLAILLLVPGTLCAELLTTGDDAPTFILPSPDGRKIKVTEYRNLTIFNFWATWRLPCLKELPELQKLYETYKDKGVTFFAISIDKKGEGVVNPFVRENSIT